MGLTKRIVKNKLYVYGGTVLLATFLLYLQTIGVQTGHSGDIICGGNIVCDGYFWINVPASVTNYLGQTVNITQLCFGKDLKIQLDPSNRVTNFGLYKADMRYGITNPSRWKAYDFAGNCLAVGNHTFKINGTKDSKSVIKWSIGGTDIDPVWGSIKESGVKRYNGATDFENNDGSHTLSIGTPNAWNGDDWVDSSEFTKIVSVKYDNGTVNITAPYWYRTYRIFASVNGVEKELSKQVNNHTLKKFDRLDNLEWGINITNIPTAVSTKLDYIEFRLVEERGDSVNIGVDWNPLAEQGFTLQKTNGSIRITNPKAMVNSGVLWMDPTIFLTNGNITDDTRIGKDASVFIDNEDVGGDDDLNLNSAALRPELVVARFGGLNFTPSGAFITNATVAFYVQAEAIDASESFSIAIREIYQPPSYTVGGFAWTEGAGTITTAACGATNGVEAAGSIISWMSRPNITSTMNHTALDTWLTPDAGGGTLVWHVFNVTQAVNRSYMSGYRNISFMLNATAATGAPSTLDCLWYASMEDSTAASRPKFNITYTMPVVNTSCTYSGTGNYIVDCGSLCRITSAFNVLGNITIRGEGTFTTLVNIGYRDKITTIGNSSTAKCKVTCNGGCFKKVA